MSRQNHSSGMERRETGTVPELCVILSTVPPALSAALAKSLLEKHIAACINILPVRSLYRWKGEACDDEEHLLVIKTQKSLADAVVRAIRARHPYEVPEIIVVPVTGGSAAYLAWAAGETKEP